MLFENINIFEIFLWEDGIYARMDTESSEEEYERINHIFWTKEYPLCSRNSRQRSILAILT